jgi:hypothetical protein
LQGPAAGLADLAAYHPAWYLRQNFGSAAPPLDGFPRLQTWAERIAAIGHGGRSQLSAQQALDVTRDATSIATATVDFGIPTVENLARPLPSRRTILDAIRLSVTCRLDVHGPTQDREIGEVCAFSTRRLWLHRHNR